MNKDNGTITTVSHLLIAAYRYAMSALKRDDIVFEEWLQDEIERHQNLIDTGMVTSLKDYQTGVENSIIHRGESDAD